MDAMRTALLKHPLVLKVLIEKCIAEFGHKNVTQPWQVLPDTTPKPYPSSWLA